jgi:fructoselysine and glucoselysine-specific PTS system IIA component
MGTFTARKFIIATHGTFAKGVQSSLDLIIGAMDNVYTIQAYVTENKSIEDELNVILKDLKEDEELVIFSDLLGGSVTNQILRYAMRPNVHVVSGFNLPLLIDILMADTETPVIEVIEEAIANAKEQMVYVNKLMTQDSEDSLDD